MSRGMAEHVVQQILILRDGLYCEDTDDEQDDEHDEEPCKDTNDEHDEESCDSFDGALEDIVGGATAELHSGKLSICCTVSHQQFRSLLFHTVHLHNDGMGFLCLVSSPDGYCGQAKEKKACTSLLQILEILLHLQAGRGGGRGGLLLTYTTHYKHLYM